MEYRKRIKLKNVLNCRDLGGYETEYGVTKFGRFLRAGVVEVPDAWEVKILEEYGVKTVIDLRGEFETADMNPHLDRIKDADVKNISLYEANVANANGTLAVLNEIYNYIVDSNRESIRTVLEAIADAKDGTLMYHCFFGKDRTGILSLLLLTIAGVQEDDIIADYQVTYTYVEKYVEDHSDILWSQDREMHYSKPESMKSLIAHLKEMYGSVYEYILSTGISEGKIDKIRRRFF